MQKIGKYVIVRKIGSGGMGVVYAAADPANGRVVAVKLLPAHAVRDIDARRFEREAWAASQVSHPNTVAVLDTGEHDGRPFLVMEFIDGRDAAQVVAHHGPLGWRTATKVLIAACKGVAAIHAAGLVHRDLKPSNLLISSTGVVKVADFGLAKLAGRPTRTLTGEGTVGTPHFMSPEQCRNEPLDARTDVYALGATFYALLTGKPPFRGDHDLTVMFAHCNDPAPDPRAVRAKLPPGCGPIVSRAMAKRPADRYPSARALQASLEALLDRDGTATDETAERPMLELPPSTTASGPVVPVELVIGQRTWNRRKVLVAGSAAVLGAGTAWLLAGKLLGRANPDTPLSDTGRAAPTAPATSSPPAVAGNVWTMPTGEVAAVAVSPNGRRVAVGVSTNGKGGVYLFERPGGRPVPGWPKWTESPCEGLAFSRDGTLLAATTGGVSRVRLWQFGSERELSWDGLKENNGVRPVAFSPDGKWLAAGVSMWGSGPPYVRVWSLPDGKPVRDVPTRQMPHTVSFSSDGSLLIAAVWKDGATDGAFEAWSVGNWAAKPLPNPTAKRKEYSPSAAFASGAKRLALADLTGVRILDVPDFQERRPFIEAGESAMVALSPDGSRLAASADVILTIWDTATGMLLQRHEKAHLHAIFSLTFTDEGRTLVSGADRTVRFWDVK